ncbi:proline and serine-rich protein 2 [Gastrophryne carolinensis]
MPSNLLKLSSSSMESEFHPNLFERSGSFDSQGSRHSRSRSSTLDDENLKHLTNEEKNVLMFFEETLDAFEDEIEEPPIPVTSNAVCSSPRTIEDSHSDNDDIIDLVQNEQNRVGISLDSGLTTNDKSYPPNDYPSEATLASSAPVIKPVVTSHGDESIYTSELPNDHPKLLGAIPTPVILAQKISEKKVDDAHLSLILPKDEKLPEMKKSVATSPISDSDFTFLSSPVGKLSRFPNNISIKRAGKEYNKTIAKAAVNVGERRAKVIANLQGPGFSEEIDGKTREPINRRTSFRDVAPEQARYMALTKLGLINEVEVQADLHATSASTSPVSNGQHSPTFFLPASQRRPSNEQVKNNSQQPAKTFSPDGNTKILHEQHLINGQSSPVGLPSESSKRFTNEHHYFNGPQSPKRMSSESNKNILQDHHFVSGQQSPKALPSEPTRRFSNEQHYFSGAHSPKLMSPEPNKKILQEQHFINGQQSPKALLAEPSKRFSTELHYFNGPQSPKAISPELNKKIHHEQQFTNGHQPAKYLSPESNISESNRTPSNTQENLSRVLMSAPSSFVPLGKTIVIKGESPSTDKSKPHNMVHINHEEKPNTRQEIKRTYSVPRPSGFRPQGITVQFSGRDSSEETRKDALRKLGLLKEDYRP